MPALPCGDDHRALLLHAQRGHRLGLGLCERRLLDGLTFAVEPVELGRHRASLRRVVFQEQPRAEVGTSDASARIDARPKQKSQMPAFRRAGEPRRIHQCGQADMLAAAHRDQPLRNEGAVEPLERHDIGDRAERHKVERVEQVGLRAQHMPEAAFAQLAVHRDHHHEHKADRGEMVEPGKIVLPVRVDQRIDRRQSFVRLMMVDRHHVEAERLRLNERLDTGRSAIDRDEELRALPGECAHRFGVRPVAFEKPVGNVDQRLKSAMAQELRQQRRGGRAVDVVVAEDRDRLAPLDRIGDTRRRFGHVGQRVRVRHQAPHRRIEKLLHRVDLDIAPGEYAREQFRHAVALRHRGRARVAARIEPRTPDAPARRALHAEERGRHFAEGR